LIQSHARLSESSPEDTAPPATRSRETHLRIPLLREFRHYIEHDRITSIRITEATTEIAIEPRHPARLEKKTNIDSPAERRATQGRPLSTTAKRRELAIPGPRGSRSVRRACAWASKQHSSLNLFSQNGAAVAVVAGRPPSGDRRAGELFFWMEIEQCGRQ